MTKTTTNLFCLAVACLILGLAFVTGIINAQNMVALYVTLPLGAVFFGLFLIFRMLEKEASLYDDEHEVHTANASVPAKKQEATSGCTCSSHAPGTSPAAH